MLKILVIDHDVDAVDIIGHTLQEEGHQVLPALNASAGFRALHGFEPHVALIGVDLPDGSGVDVVRAFRARVPSPSCVVLAGASHRNFDDVIEAMRLGAVDCLRKPLHASDVLKAVGRLTSLTPGVLQGSCLHAHERWVQVVTKAITSPADLRNLQEWGRWTGASTGAIRNWCRTAQLPARQSLLFARFLRAIVRQHDAGSENLLNIVDRRTLIKLVARSGGTGLTLPESVDEYLQRQQFIDNPAAVRLIAHALRTQLMQRVR